MKLSVADPRLPAASAIFTTREWLPLPSGVPGVNVSELPLTEQLAVTSAPSRRTFSEPATMPLDGDASDQLAVKGGCVLKRISARGGSICTMGFTVSTKKLLCSLPVLPALSRAVAITECGPSVYAT